MKCPVCKEVDLVMADRQGVEIDYCPACRGVWLDRGELDNIIERSTPAETSGRAMYRADSEHEQHDDHERDHRHRRKSWLGELFD
jgi:uncharacterized protein